MEHPAAKSMIEIARTQDEEVGDGTTSVIILGTVKKKHNFASTVFLPAGLKCLCLLKESYILVLFQLESCWQWHHLS